MPIIQILNSVETTQGQWINCASFRIPFTVCVFGFAAGGGDTVACYVSNSPTPPPLQNPVAGDGQFFYDLVPGNNPGYAFADAWAAFTFPFLWMRLAKTISSGKLTQAYLCALAVDSTRSGMWTP